MNQRFSRSCLIALVTALVLPPQLEAHSDDGVFTRTIEIEVRPSDVPVWEASMESIAGAIRKTESDVRLHWLVYRSGVAKYFVVVNRFSLDEVVALENLRKAISDVPESSPLKSALISLESTDFTVTKDVLWHQHVELSTVPSMSTESHPLAVVTEYSMKPEKSGNFDQAMSEYVSFLKRIGYVYPVEGFHWLLGRPGCFMSVTFPDTWIKYYSGAAVDTFVAEKGLSAELSGIRQRLLETTQSVDETYLTFAPELSP